MPEIKSLPKKSSDLFGEELDAETLAELEKVLAADSEMAENWLKISQDSNKIRSTIKSTCPKTIEPPAPEIFRQKIMSRISVEYVPLKSLDWDEDDFPSTTSVMSWDKWKMPLLVLGGLTMGLVLGSWWQAYHDSDLRRMRQMPVQKVRVEAPTYTIETKQEDQKSVVIPQKLPTPPAHYHYPER